jgi:STE24 endopeptidase
VSLAAHQKAADYTIVKARFGLLELAFGAAVLLGWTLLGGLHVLNQALLAWLGGGMVQQLALLGAFMLIGGLIDLPFTLYQTFVIEERFGFNKMTWRLWLYRPAQVHCRGHRHRPARRLADPVADGRGRRHLVAVGLGRVDGVQPAVAADLPHIHRAAVQQVPAAGGRNPQGARDRADAALRLCGQGPVRDGRQQAQRPCQRVFHRLWRRQARGVLRHLLAKLSPGEVDAVLAHELGHFRHKHILKRIVSLFALSLAGFALLGWLSTQAWFYTGLGVRPNMDAPNDALALLLFLLAVPVFTFFISPLFAQLSRKHEFEADAYAVGHTSTART